MRELELVFEEKYGDWKKEALRKEAEELARALKEEKKKVEILELQEKLETADEETTKEILRKIQTIQKG